MEFRNKKVLEFGAFFLIIMSFVVMGYYTYHSYSKQKEKSSEVIKIDNYYNPDYLFNNDYIKLADTIDSFSDEKKDIYMYLDKDNTFYIKYTNGNISYNKHITNLPKGKLSVYYNNLYDDYYELVAVSDEKDLYYVTFNLKSKKNYTFYKINGKVNSVYVPSYDKGNVYVNKKDKFVTNFIFSDSDNNLKYLDYKKNEYYLKDDFESVKPYFDYICVSDSFSVCDNTMIYQTFENKLIYKFNNKVVKNESGEEIIVKDMFATFEIDSKKIVNLDNISFDELNKKYDYNFIVYVVDKEDNFYKLELNKKVLKEKQEVSAVVSSLEKVKQIVINSKDGKSKDVHVVYIDGEETKITEDLNKKIVTSTVYDKNKDKLIETS